LYGKKREKIPPKKIFKKKGVGVRSAVVGVE
jgi:hypothetical protein